MHTGLKYIDFLLGLCCAAVVCVPLQARDCPHTYQGLPAGSFTDIAFDKYNYMWLAGRQGELYRWDGRTSERVEGVSGEGGVELSGNGSGSVFIRKGVRLYSGLGTQISTVEKEGSALIYEGSQATDVHGRNWFLVNGRPCESGAAPYERFGSGNGLPGEITALQTDRGGRLWVGSPAGLFYKRENRFFPAPALFPQPRIKAMEKGAEGRLWILDEDGQLLLYDPGNFRPSDSRVWSDLPLRQIAFDQSGSLYALTDSLLLRFRKGTRSPLVETETFLLPPEILGNKPDLLVAGDQAWLFSVDGLWYLGAESADTLLRLGNTPVYAAAAEGEGLWLLDERGRLRRHGEEKVAFEFPFVATGEMKLHAGNDGFWLAGPPGVWRVDRNGSDEKTFYHDWLQDSTSVILGPMVEEGLWLSSGGEIYLFRTENLSVNPAPVLHVAKVQSREYMPEGKTVRIPHDHDQIKVELKATDLYNSGPVFYQYRRDGHWSEFNKDGTFIFPAERAGDYEYEFRAINYADAGSKPVLLTLEVAAPPWQQPGFPLYILAGIIIFLLLAGLLMSYWRDRKKRSEIRKLLRRNELLELRQKSAQLQLNPHFIFNAITGIQGLIAEDRKREARAQLGSFARLMRAMLEHSRMDWVPLEEELAWLESYAGLASQQHRTSLDFRIDNRIDEKISIPPMLIQPFVENAIFHAFRGRKEGKLKVKLEYIGKWVGCTIEDDGIGFEPSGKEGRGAHALEIIRERLAAYAPESEDPMLQVESEEGKGSRVRLRFPYIKSDAKHNGAGAN